MATWKKDWTPVLNGRVYCSPACGGGITTCSKAAYDHAVKASKALARRMGKGWKPVVWENLGWYYSVKKGKSVGTSGFGFLEITPPHHPRQPKDTYTAWVQSSPQFIAHHEDPTIALRVAVEQFDSYLAALNKQRALVDALFDK